MSTPAPHVEAYERVIYQASVISDTLPGRMGAVARLFGLHPADPREARVLELGCGTGINLLSMAALQPGGRYLGLDASHAQIALGKTWAAEAGLDQVELRAQRIEELRDPGPFDYIVSHGVYSWVPPEVQEALLRSIARRLAPQGVAFLSFNALPGWHVRGAIRAAMLWEAQGLTEVQERVGAARRAARLLRDTAAPGPWGELLRLHLDEVDKLPDWYLFHDLLAEHNEALYLHQFSERLAPHGLRALATVPLEEMVVDALPAPVAEQVQVHARGDRLRGEELIDLYRVRPFRRMLLCRADAVPELGLSAEVWPALSYEPRLVQGEEGFASREGRLLSSERPLARASMHQLYARRPRAVGFSELLEAVRGELGVSTPEDPARLAHALRELVLLGGASPRLLPWQSPTHSRRPRAPTLARVLAAHGADAVPNLTHESVQIDFFRRQVLLLADGQRTPADMVNALIEQATSGQIDLLDEHGARVSEPLALVARISTELSEVLQQMPRMGLLEG